MIERYSLPKMKEIWSEQNRFQKMLQVEILACEALAKAGYIPRSALQKIRKNARFNVARITELEKTTNHDVVAFLMNLSENIGPEGRYIHFGLTSSDVVDTAFSSMMKGSADIIIEDLKRFLKVLSQKAKKYKKTPMIGRTHGVHAEPTTFGLKMALFYAETKRNIKRMEEARETIAVGKLSGAVGTFANIDPFVEEYVCKGMDLQAAPVSTQILQRDRHAQFMTTIAIIGGTIEKIALEVRGLQKTEIGEVEEFFGKGQKGSSAMPHKRNPVLSERLCGLARVLRGNAQAALEDMALWHERDISHSSVERVVVPDSVILLDYMLNRASALIENLVVYPEKMMENLSKSRGIIYSQRILLELVHKGLTRQEAYAIVQRNTMAARDQNRDFKELLLGDEEVTRRIPKQELDELFSLDFHLRNVDTIFKRVGL